MSRVYTRESVVCLFINLPIKTMQGTVKSVNEKGFGFISVEGQEKDVFFHQSALVGMEFNDVRVGDAVTFETEQSEKGPRAVNVQRA